ncbi:MAG: STAS domain-containing protein [Verrucomicrobiaceae bacterium]|nr:STAS domain-containing protein [Verrucomicrobiaceae bacterium]
MEIKIISQPSSEIIVIKGRLDVTTTQDLEKTFTDLFNAGKNKMLIDCTELEYISSAGLRTLLTAAKTSKKIDGKIVLANLNTNVKQIFEISGFTSIFDIFDSLQNAVSALES